MYKYCGTLPTFCIEEHGVGDHRVLKPELTSFETVFREIAQAIARPYNVSLHSYLLHVTAQFGLRYDSTHILTQIRRRPFLLHLTVKITETKGSND